jgi:hypothetical protein
MIGPLDCVSNKSSRQCRQFEPIGSWQKEGSELLAVLHFAQALRATSLDWCTANLRDGCIASWRLFELITAACGVNPLGAYAQAGSLRPPPATKL